jgi:hypothetical protein
MYLITAIIVYIWSQDIYVKGALSAKIVNSCYPYKLSDMIDALIKRASVAYKGATDRVLRSIKKWTPSY